MPSSGGCLCAAIRFELDAEIKGITNCHCQFCRRAHGAAFVTSTIVQTADFRITQGEDELAHHEARYFCRICASRLFNRVDALPTITVLVFSALDDPPAIEVSAHLNVESKAPWFEILDDRPQFDALPPSIAAMVEGSRKG